MKKILVLISILIIVALAVVLYISRVDIATGIKDRMNIRPQQFYGVTVDMSQILPESKHYIINNKKEDLIDIAASLGMNTLRITNIRSIVDNKATPSYSHAQWAEVLGKMKKKGMYAVILAEGNSQDTFFHDTTFRDYYVNFEKNYIVTPDLCSFSNVLAVDIADEPALNKNNLEKIMEASKVIKTACPGMKITIGSWKVDSGQRDESGNIIYNWHDPKEVKQIDNIVDIIFVHIYGFDKLNDNKTYPDPYALTTGYLNEIRKYTSKPIFIEEFGAGNGSVKTDQNTIGSKELQKNAYNGVLRAMYDFKNRGVLGATAYLFISRSDQPDGWSISEDNGNVFLPAAFTFKNFSKN